MNTSETLKKSNNQSVKPPATKAWFTPRVLAWAKTHGRHSFPWQHPHTPYKTWISEVMLQQTQASRVEPFFTAFLAARDRHQQAAT